MTHSEKMQLAELLEQMCAEGEKPGEDPDEPDGRPPGFIPEVALKAFYKATRTPFLELIIFRQRADSKPEYLYQDRHDQWWNGFCAFGGMIRRDHPSTMVDLAQKLMRREFEGLQVSFKSLQIVSALNWPSHPWSNPFAIVCLIDVEGHAWLSTDALPENMVINHGTYLRQCDYFLEHGPLVFTPEQPFGVPWLKPPFEEYVAPAQAVTS